MSSTNLLNVSNLVRIPESMFNLSGSVDITSQMKQHFHDKYDEMIKGQKLSFDKSDTNEDQPH